MSIDSSTLSAQSICDDFMDFCSQRQEIPTALTDFLTAQEYDERSLLRFYGSVLELEQGCFLRLFDMTLELLSRDSAYVDYVLQEQTLAFYYTFFELLTANQDYFRLSLRTQTGIWGSPLQPIVKAFNQNLLLLPVLSPAALPKLNRLKKALVPHLQSLHEPYYADLLPLRKMQKQFLGEAIWVQFLSFLNYWLHDSSPEHERLDVLIERSLAASYEILSLVQMRQVQNLFRFWLQEQPKTK
jgi:hypothetical protein